MYALRATTPWNTAPSSSLNVAIRLEVWSGLTLIPQLTHLSFHDDHIPNSVCQSALVHLKSLDVLAIVFSSRALLDMFVPDHEVFVTDPRFVLLMVTDPLEDWETGARGGEDYWARADALVKTRRAGQHLLNFTLEELQEKLAQNRARLEALRRESECEAARRELRHEAMRRSLSVVSI
ncbi:hypothetical protein B0H10DRAFT_1964017 [Mycena sp. CBHHK59/15]|nr:hypothetical protein B0H10DRAFT_1964017 [Mycena sp. CBHHK59/15]